jgi:hypothetical protein
MRQNEVQKLETKRFGDCSYLQINVVEKQIDGKRSG